MPFTSLMLIVFKEGKKNQKGKKKRKAE